MEIVTSLFVTCRHSALRDSKCTSAAVWPPAHSWSTNRALSWGRHLRPVQRVLWHVYHSHIGSCHCASARDIEPVNATLVLLKKAALDCIKHWQGAKKGVNSMWQGSGKDDFAHFFRECIHTAREADGTSRTSPIYFQDWAPCQRNWQCSASWTAMAFCHTRWGDRKPECDPSDQVPKCHRLLTSDKYWKYDVRRDKDGLLLLAQNGPNGYYSQVQFYMFCTKSSQCFLFFLCVECTEWCYCACSFWSSLCRSQLAEAEKVLFFWNTSPPNNYALQRKAGSFVPLRPNLSNVDMHSPMQLCHVMNR